MWWTRERRRAMAVAGRVEPRERCAGAQDERRFGVRQNRVVLTPVAGAKSAVATQTRPGLRSHLNPPTTVTRRIRRRGERGISRKAITQGMPDASAEPVCSCAHFLVHLAHETAGAARTRHSLRPPVSRASAIKTRAHRAARLRSHVLHSRLLSRLAP